jgi:hypothetical protein
MLQTLEVQSINIILYSTDWAQCHDHLNAFDDDGEDGNDNVMLFWLENVT